MDEEIQDTSSNDPLIVSGHFFNRSFSKWNTGSLAPSSLSAWQKIWMQIHDFRNKDHFINIYRSDSLFSEFLSLEIRITSTFGFFCQGWQAVRISFRKTSICAVMAVQGHHHKSDLCACEKSLYRVRKRSGIYSLR